MHPLIELRRASVVKSDEHPHVIVPMTVDDLPGIGGDDRPLNPDPVTQKSLAPEHLPET
jgi:hypothetical protein